MELHTLSAVHELIRGYGVFDHRKNGGFECNRELDTVNGWTR